MTKRMNTRGTLLQNARSAFWAQGYSNVSVRQIASASGVDVALISRYFGGKLGLFEATLEGAFSIEGMETLDKAGLVETIVQTCVETPRGGAEPMVMRMLLMNAHDDVVGQLVGLFQVLRGQQAGGAISNQLADQVPQVVAAAGV